MHELVIIVAKYFVFLSILLALWAFVRLPRAFRKEFVLFGIVGGVLTLLFAMLGSHVFYDPRPFVVGHFTPYFSHGNDNGFPSDHTLLASFLAFFIWHYSRKLGTALFVLAIMIGLARVQAGVHHLIDIVGSFVFSAIGVGAAYFITQHFVKLSKSPGKSKPSARE